MPGCRFAFLAIIAFSVTAADLPWAQFRGPAAGVVEGANLPQTWSSTENIVWKTSIAGRGWSSPVVANDRIYLTSVIAGGQEEAPKKGLYFGGNRETAPDDEHRWMLYCVDWKSGKLLWEREVHRGKAPARHLKNSYASETPVTDGERVYAYFGSVGVFAFDRQGKQLWSMPLGPFRMRYGWGTAASPVLHQGRLYIVNDNEDHSFLLALDSKTGKQIWRVSRDEGSNWSTPFVWEHDGRFEIVTTGTRSIRSYDPDGKLLWELGPMSSIAIPTPFSKFNLLYLTSGYVGDEVRPVYAVRPGASGNISLKKNEDSNQYVVWHHPQAGPYNPSPLVYGDYYYTLLDRGFFTCHDARTGKEVYGKQRIDTASTAFTASPWAYDGKIFALSEDGDTFVLQAGPEFKVLGKNSLDEMCMATPAIYRSSLILRGASKVYRIGKGGNN
jgi:outer membrane protein assembly factor BamB